VIIVTIYTIRGGHSCSRVRFVSFQLMNIQLYGSTLTRHIY